MATSINKIWRFADATARAWATASNWLNEDGSTSGAAPGTTATVYFNGGNATGVNNTIGSLVINGDTTIAGTALTVNNDVTINGVTLNYTGTGSLSVGRNFTNSGQFNQTNTSTGVLTFNGAQTAVVDWGGNNCCKVTVAKTTTTSITFNGDLYCNQTNTTASVFTFTSGSFVQVGAIVTRVLTNNSTTARTWSQKGIVYVNGTFTGTIVNASQTTCTYTDRTGYIQMDGYRSTTVTTVLTFGAGVPATCPRLLIAIDRNDIRIQVTGSVYDLYVGGNYLTAGTVTVFGGLYDTYATSEFNWTAATINKPAPSAGATTTTECYARIGTINFLGGATSGTAFNSAATHTVNFCRANTITTSTTAITVVYNFNSIEVGTALSITPLANPNGTTSSWTYGKESYINVSYARPYAGVTSVTTTIGAATSSSTNWSYIYFEDVDLPGTITHNTHEFSIGQKTNSSVYCTALVSTSGFARTFNIGSNTTTSYLITRSQISGAAATGSCTFTNTGFTSGFCNGALVVAGTGTHAFGTMSSIQALKIQLRHSNCIISGTVDSIAVEDNAGVTSASTITIDGYYRGNSIYRLGDTPGAFTGLSINYTYTGTGSGAPYTHNFSQKLATVTVSGASSYVSFDYITATTLTIAGSGTTVSSDVIINDCLCDTINFQPAQTGSATSVCTWYGGTCTNLNINYTTNGTIKRIYLNFPTNGAETNWVTGTLTFTAGYIELNNCKVIVGTFTAGATAVTKTIAWSSNTDGIVVTGNCTLTSSMTFAGYNYDTTSAGSNSAGYFILAGGSTARTYSNFVWTSTLPVVRFNTEFRTTVNCTWSNWYTQNFTVTDGAIQTTATTINISGNLLVNNPNGNISGFTFNFTFAPIDLYSAQIINYIGNSAYPIPTVTHSATATGLVVDIQQLNATNINLTGANVTYHVGGDYPVDYSGVLVPGILTLSAAGSTYNINNVTGKDVTLNNATAIFNFYYFVNISSTPTTGTITHSAGTLNLTVSPYYGTATEPSISTWSFISNTTSNRIINFNNGSDTSPAYIITRNTGTINLSYQGLTGNCGKLSGFIHNSTGSINTGSVAPANTACAIGIAILNACTLPSPFYVKTFTNMNWDQTGAGSGYPTNTSAVTVNLYGDLYLSGNALAWFNFDGETVANKPGWQYLSLNISSTETSSVHSMSTQMDFLDIIWMSPLGSITIPTITLPSTFQGIVYISSNNLTCNNFVHQRGSLNFKGYPLNVNTKYSTTDTTNTKSIVNDGRISTCIYLKATTGTVWDFPKTDLLSSSWQAVINVLGGVVNHGTTTTKTTLQPSFDFRNYTNSYTISPTSSFNVGSLYLNNYSIPANSILNIGGPNFSYTGSQSIASSATINLIDGGNRQSSGNITVSQITGTSGQFLASSVTGLTLQVGQIVTVTGSFYLASPFIFGSGTYKSFTNSGNKATITQQAYVAGTTSGSSSMTGAFFNANGGSVQNPGISVTGTFEYVVYNTCNFNFTIGTNSAVRTSNCYVFASIRNNNTGASYGALSSSYAPGPVNIGSTTSGTIVVSASTSGTLVTVEISGGGTQESTSINASWNISNSSTNITGNINNYNEYDQYEISQVGTNTGSGTPFTLVTRYLQPISTSTGSVQGPIFALSTATVIAGSDTTVFNSDTTAIYPVINTTVPTKLSLSGSNSFQFNRINISNGIIFNMSADTSGNSIICLDAITATQNSSLNITNKTLEIRGANSSTTSGLQFGSNGATNTTNSGNLIGSTSSNLIFSGLNGSLAGNQYCRFSKFSSYYGGNITNNLQYTNASSSGFLYLELEGLQSVGSDTYPVNFNSINFGYSVGALQINSYYGIGVKTFNLISGIRLSGVNATYSSTNFSLILAQNPYSRVYADQLNINNFNVSGGQGWYYGTTSTVAGSYNGWQSGLLPTFTLTRSPVTSNIDEGSIATYTLTTTNLNDNTQIPFTISGTGIATSDILINGTAGTSGTFTIISNSGSFIFTAVADFTNETVSSVYETFTLSLNNQLASISGAIRDTSRIPTYSLSRSPAGDITEGNSVTITLTATSIPANYQIPYTLSGTATNGTDYTLSSTSGYFTLGATTVVSNILSATSTLTFNTVWDYVSEGTETVTLTTASTYGGTNTSITFNILNLLHPTYALSANPTSVTEGGNFTITLTTTDVANGTVIPYTISGTGITASDFSIGGSSSFTGNFTIQNNTSTITVTTLADYFTESSENLRLTLDTIGTLIDVPIADYYKTRTWSLATDKTTVSEGESFTITLTTTNVFDNTLVPYTISSGTSGTITTGDFTPASLTGNFTVVGGTAQQTFNIVVDAAIEGTEIFVLTLGSPANSSINITIRDPVASAGNFLILFE